MVRVAHLKSATLVHLISCLRDPVSPGIPKGCKKIARGKRSAAPGSYAKSTASRRDARPNASVDERSRAHSGRIAFIAGHSRGCASLAPGYPLASLRDARKTYILLVECLYDLVTECYPYYRDYKIVVECDIKVRDCRGKACPCPPAPSGAGTGYGIGDARY